MASPAFVRAPQARQRSGTSDDPARYKSRMLQMREDLRNEAMVTLKANPEYGRIQRYIDALEGSYYPKNFPTWRSRYVDNRMAEARTDSISYMTDLRPTINISTRIKQVQEQCTIFSRIFAHEWRRLKMPIVLAKLQDHANFGTGYLKIGGLLPGYLTVQACGMDTVLPIQRGENLQESRAVLYRTYRSLEWLTGTYGREFHSILKTKATSVAYGTTTSNQYARPGHVEEHTWNSMSPAMRHHMGKGIKFDASGPASEGAFPTYELEEYWIDDPEVNESNRTLLVKHPTLDIERHNFWYNVKPGQRMWPNKRLVVFAGDVLLYDGPSPYWHGMFPFNDYTPDPVVWAPSGLSFYRSLLPIAEAINRTGAAFEDATERALNPPLIGKESVIKDQNWQSFDPRRPGAKLRVSMMGDPTKDVRYGPDVMVPSFATNWEDKLHSRFDRRRGSVDIQQLGKKKQVPSGEVFEQMRESQSSPFRLKSALLECCLEGLCPMALANISQYYTVDQKIRYLGPDGVTIQEFDFEPGQMQPFTQPASQHWRGFTVEIEPGSMLGSSKERQELKDMALFRGGVISLQELHRRLKMPNSEAIIGEILKEHQGGLGGMPAGRTPRGTRGQRSGKAV